MTPDDARRLLDLTVEYQRAIEIRSAEEWDGVGTPAGRKPEEIAAETAELLSRA